MTTNVDHVAVSRAIEGDRTITLTDDEKHAVIIDTYHLGWSDARTATLIGCHQAKVRARRDAAGLVRRVNGAHKLGVAS